MEVVIEMTLPRDAESAPLVRHTLDASLRGLGVASEIREDIALALGEACANVIQHAESSKEYEVRAHMDGLKCVIDVIDGGRSGDAAVWKRGGRPLPVAESGRGIQLMRAFTEDLDIADRADGNGAIVHFEKSLAAQRD
ncbi:ATP-binding protein [Actinomadura sp. 21ATH]|uniref:ATP-binding protein n=1 Tax=Actinomadura sp. 21ATH TaxID=1735444 RepID=UPI0035C0221E